MPLLSRPAQTAIGAGVVAAAVVLAYSDSFGGPLVYDDIPSIFVNESIRHLGQLRTVLFPPGGTGFTHEGRPLLNLSLALNYAVGGTNVLGYHVGNLLIHLLASLAAFGLVRRTLEVFRPKDTPQQTALRAAAVALLWAVHPLQTESVTYLVQRAESLVGLFYLLSLYTFARYATSGRMRWAVLCVAATWAGMGAKELMVTVPVMVLVYDRTFFAGSFTSAWKNRRGFYLALASSWAPLLGLLAANGWNRGGSAGFGSGTSWTGYVLTQPEAVCRYLWLSLCPTRLNFDYGPLQRSFLQALPFGVIVASLGLASLWALRRRPALGFLGFFFFGILAVTSLIPGGSEMFVEHRMYLPLLPIVVLVVDSLWRLPGRAGPAIVALAGLLLGGATWERNQVYKSDIALWKDSVEKASLNSRGWYDLGVVYYSHGDAENEMASYRKAIEIDINNYDAQHMLANALVRAGKPQEALPHYDRAISHQPNYGRLRADAAAALAEMGHWEDAIAEAHAALRLDSKNAKAHDTLGVCLMQTKQDPSARDEFNVAIELDPSLVSAHANLGILLASHGQFDAARLQLEKAVELDPKLGRAQYSLGNVLCQEGRYYEAVRAYEAALALIPPNPDLQGNLGLAYLQTEQPDKALPYLEAVVKQRGNSKQARHNLAAAYSALGRNAEAQAQLDAETKSTAD